MRNMQMRTSLFVTSSTILCGHDFWTTSRGIWKQQPRHRASVYQFHCNYKTTFRKDAWVRNNTVCLLVIAGRNSSIVENLEETYECTIKSKVFRWCSSCNTTKNQIQFSRYFTLWARDLQTRHIFWWGLKEYIGRSSCSCRLG